MAGVVGREIKAAYARSSTWGVPASVTRQLYLTSIEGLDADVSIVDDETFNQNFLLPGETADENPLTPELNFQARYEDVDTWFAAGLGSPAAPVVISSAAANSLVAYEHVVLPSVELSHFLTLAVDMQNYVHEVPTLKVRGFTMRVGENGRMQVGFSIVGAKANYDSTTNTNSTVGGARAASLGNRLFRKDARFRMNVQSAGALGASDELVIIKEITLGTARPVAGDDFVFNQSYIIEPEDDGFPDFPVEVVYARMHTQSANSLVVGLKAARVFKADWRFLGPYINSTTQRQFQFEFPALQLRNIRIAATGGGQVRPMATFSARLAATSPAGMAFVLPMRLSIINANSQNLLA